VIIGAGPAGSMTAGLLAGQGHDVLVVEEHQEVGHPAHCTGLLGMEAIDELKLPRQTILNVVDAARFWAGRQSVLIESEHIRAAVIDRPALDRWLAETAADAGAELRSGCRAESIERIDGGLRVHLRGSIVDTRACVLACGASYRFHKVLGLGGPRAYLRSAQVEVPFSSTGPVDVWLGRQLAPGGFAWRVPFRRNGNPSARIGIMCESDSTRRFHRFASEVAAVGDIDAGSLPQPRLKVLPLGPVSRTYTDRLVAVGDAAGLVKPTTGGGIFFGLLSGTYAAEILDDRLRQDRLAAEHLRAYEVRWRERLGPEIRTGLAFRKVADLLGDAAVDALIELARTNGIAKLMKEHASFNWHRKAALALLGNSSFRKIVLSSLLT
jgi:geranylgeranyl reductase family protein